MVVDISVTGAACAARIHARIVYIDLIEYYYLIFDLILVFKNSVEKLDSFKTNYQTVLFTGIIFVSCVLSLSKNSPFLYFNF